MPSTASRMISLLFLITPVICHRFITGNEPNNAFDSIIVSSDPIKITNNKYNEVKNSTTTTRKPDYAIRFNRNALTNDNDLEATNSEERSFKDCKHNDIKCLYDSSVADKTESSTNKNQDIINKFLEQYSSITNVKFNLEEFENTTKDEADNNDDKNVSDLKKSYWSLVNSEKHNHPYDDKKGWVTLEPVPWSSSKVSKWQSHVQPSHTPSSNNNNNHHNNYHHQPPNYQSQSYYPSQPQYPTHSNQQQDNRPWNYGPTQTPTAQVWVTNRPSYESEQYGHYVKPTNPFSNYRPSSQWGIGSNDIITDNRPNEFPDGSNVYGTYQKPHYHFGNQYTGPPKYNEVQNFNNGYPGARPTRYPMPTGHPSTYPDRGNGEWILLSTTKGYSLPQRYRDTPKIVSIDTKSNDLAHDPMITSRNMKYPDISRYHEENIDDKYVLVSKNSDVNRKSGEEVESNMENTKIISNDDQNKTENPWNIDGLRLLHSESGGSILAAPKMNARNGKDDWKMEENPINVLQTKTKVDGEPIMTYKRTVRLTVLPPLSNSSTTAHDGLLEVDSSYQQTVDESQQEEEKLKKLSELANIKKANFGKYKLVPVSVQGISGKSMNHKSAAVLAAVGAGMIPATMAVLVPMALGRKKRDIDSSLLENKISSHDFPSQYRHRNSARW